LPGGVNLLLGGPQGGGLETAMLVLARALARAGYGLLADREYHSNIVGKHSYIHMRVSTRGAPKSLDYPVDVLAAMDAETIFTHFTDLGPGGVLVYDSGASSKRLDEQASMEEAARKRAAEKLAGVGFDVESLAVHLRDSKGVHLVPVNFQEVLAKVGERYRLDPARLSRYVSSILVGAVAAVLGLNPEHVKHSLNVQFKGRTELVEPNVAIMEEVERLVPEGAKVPLNEPEPPWSEVMVVSGNDVVAIAKLAAGVRYQSYYPITPAADECLLMERYEYVELDGVQLGPSIVLQMEDEIAAITSAIGAALAGARSSTATSGPGFDLMVEGLSYAGMNEVPVVVTYYQRGGPSTGLPTRGAQSDLLSAVFASHGEFAKVVLSSGDHEEAFYDTMLAFNIAERYQVPVIHLLDKFLANTVTTMPVPDPEKVSVDRGLLAVRPSEYKRFDARFEVSPRAFLGEGPPMWYTGDEHDEYGHISEDPANRVVMYSKRMEKLKLIKRELPGEQKLAVYGSDAPDFLVMGWGSVKGVALDALEKLNRKGFEAAYVNLKLLHPFPKREVEALLQRAREVVAVEHSYEAQVGKLVAMWTGRLVEKSVVKFTGRPITLSELVEALELIFSGKRERVVLTYGA